VFGRYYFIKSYIFSGQAQRSVYFSLSYIDLNYEETKQIEVLSMIVCYFFVIFAVQCSLNNGKIDFSCKNYWIKNF
jgi:hypothetical protein